MLCQKSSDAIHECQKRCKCILPMYYFTMGKACCTVKCTNSFINRTGVLQSLVRRTGCQTSTVIVDGRTRTGMERWRIESLAGDIGRRLYSVATILGSIWNVMPYSLSGTA